MLGHVSYCPCPECPTRALSRFRREPQPSQQLPPTPSPTTCGRWFTSCRWWFSPPFRYRDLPFAAAEARELANSGACAPLVGRVAVSPNSPTAPASSIDAARSTAAAAVAVDVAAPPLHPPAPEEGKSAELSHERRRRSRLSEGKPDGSGGGSVHRLRSAPRLAARPTAAKAAPGKKALAWSCVDLREKKALAFPFMAGQLHSTTRAAASSPLSSLSSSSSSLALPTAPAVLDPCPCFAPDASWDPPRGLGALLAMAGGSNASSGGAEPRYKITGARLRPESGKSGEGDGSVGHGGGLGGGNGGGNGGGDRSGLGGGSALAAAYARHCDLAVAGFAEPKACKSSPGPPAPKKEALRNGRPKKETTGTSTAVSTGTSGTTGKTEAAPVDLEHLGQWGQQKAATQARGESEE